MKTVAGYCIEWFVDDFGNWRMPWKLDHTQYLSRRYYFKGD